MFQCYCISFQSDYILACQHVGKFNMFVKILELRAILMEKENQLSKTRQELEELQEYKV